MRKRLLTPGPTPVPEETLLELARPVHYHRSTEARQVLAEVRDGLQYVLQTKNDVIALTCSGTGAMEAALVNSVRRGGKGICLYSGRFGERWHKLWQVNGIHSIAVTAPPGRAVAPEQLETALRQHPDADAVCLVHCETSTGVKQDVAACAGMVAKTPAILIVDGISSVAAMECRTDLWGIDLLATGSQKALMAPPGLAFLAVSPKAWAKIETHEPTAFYFDLKKYRAALSAGPDTPFTPAHTLLRALRASLQRICAEGIERVWQRHAQQAKAARAALSALGLQPFADPPAESVTAVQVPAGVDGGELLQRIEARFGIKLAGGQDQLKGKIIRLGHMGYADYFDILAAVAAVELVLWEMGAPVEMGAALTAAQRAFAAT